ncbi:hypothetical protein BsWGS_09424 [Bradybaena similaris]
MDRDEVHDEDVVYHLRDKNLEIVEKWAEYFALYEVIKMTQGDIFQGAPAADAIVSPGNSFGFMNGAIDSYYKQHFGAQIQTNLQKTIREKYSGELLLGQAAIVPIGEYMNASKDWSQINNGTAIKYLIYAPTMRTPVTVANTPNAYLAFRAVILAISAHNRMPNVDKIKAVLVPGLGTAAGKMPTDRCAWQMLQAYETHVLGKHATRLTPKSLGDVITDSYQMSQFGGSQAEASNIFE